MERASVSDVRGHSTPRQSPICSELLASLEKERKEHAAIRQDLEQRLLRATSITAPARDDSASRLQAVENRALGEQVKKLGELLSELRGRVTELEKDKAGLTKERDELANTVAEQKRGHATLARQISRLDERAKAAERKRTELVAQLPAVDRLRDELAAKPAREPSRHEPSHKEILDEGNEGEGADSIPPRSPTGIVIPRLAFGGNLPPVRSPKPAQPRNLGAKPAPANSRQRKQKAQAATARPFGNQLGPEPMQKRPSTTLTERDVCVFSLPPGLDRERNDRRVRAQNQRGSWRFVRPAVIRCIQNARDATKYR